ncbi:penicillin-insensitive murein endopeptidase [Enterovibrio sp. ZSDZ35]|uniref:Penicillin-insensitive murein endopeptidase n=1 Tax=Enterovibrio qingdaonensis TaxID=2899818 RepID=A0ABT5QTN9_9GAMM|nr:penicillin-insensitive murein endopeptidase [Enterovibrio sp. ZSDZ35]MDD1784341.1 penicillin-insensitive murein endopeptidase [Enterovibrio sp. ZSDZ35]
MKKDLLMILFICMFLLGAYMAIAQASPWEGVKAPYEGQEQSIGSYANGCLSGGEALPLQGEGFQVIRPSRNRYYGHPDMIAYLTKLGAKTKAFGLDDLLIADIAMPRGGNFSSGHASHQTGLDADIWLSFAPETLTKTATENQTAVSLVDLKNYKLRRENWLKEHAILFQVAASEPEVARIFVHPVIKETLCGLSWEDRSWLQKVRPWWGHHYHMHVRLRCPEGSTSCVNQKAPPLGDGCGAELISWRPKPEDDKKTASVTKKKKAKIKPAQCTTVLTQ